MDNPYLFMTFVDGTKVKADIDLESLDEIEVALEKVQEGAGTSIPIEGGRFIIPPGALLYIEVSGALLDSAGEEDYEVDDLDFIE